MSNAMSLKAKIRNIAKQKNIPAQVILQNYMFERLLVRLLHRILSCHFFPVHIFFFFFCWILFSSELLISKMPPIHV